MRGLRIIHADEVPRLLPMPACIEAVEEAFRSLARDEARQPLRTVLPLPDGASSFLTMPAFLEHPPALGAKLLTLFPANHDRGIPAHQGVIVLFDPEDGSLTAVVDAGPVTALRTAAASGVATRLLANPEASELAVLGTGVQARSHVEAMLAVRPIVRLRAWSPNPRHLERFVEEMAHAHGITAEAASSARTAVEGADVICTVTSSSEPVLSGAWLRPGAHVNAVGASTATSRELDTEAVVRSRCFMDDRTAALAEAGDFLIPLAEGAIGDAHLVGEIGAVLEGRVPGRRSREEITLFKSLGLAVQDLAAVRRMLEDG